MPDYNFDRYFESYWCNYPLSNMEDMKDARQQAAAEEDDLSKLERQFRELKDELRRDGFITVGYFCKIMGLECENPYDIYCGDRKKWAHKIGEEISKCLLKDSEENETKFNQLLEALCNDRETEEEED